MQSFVREKEENRDKECWPMGQALTNLRFNNLKK
jgi:hypothetical protein